MITIKKPEEVGVLREGGRRLAAVLERLVAMVRPGVTGDQLEDEARRLIATGGDRPSFLNYKGKRDEVPYPAVICLSINDEVVHSPPFGKVIRRGDLVSVDAGLIHRSLFVDAARTVPVTGADEAAKKLSMVTKEALRVGIGAVRAGATVGDIGAAIELFVRPYGLGIVRNLAGHGVGYAVHEEPLIPNFGKRGEGEVLREGMVLAIEPMLNEGSHETRLAPDGFTVTTRDGARSAHFEDTVVVTKGGAEVLTSF